MRLRPELHETEIEIETDYYETKIESKKLVSRPDETLTFLSTYCH